MAAELHPPSLPLGTVLDDGTRITEFLGQSAGGESYRGEHPRFGAVVAKLLSAEVEAIVPLFANELDQDPWFRYRLVPGETSEQWEMIRQSSSSLWSVMGGCPSHGPRAFEPRHVETALRSMLAAVLPRLPLWIGTLAESE